VWVTIATNATATPTRNRLVGVSDVGASALAASFTLATDLPLTTAPDITLSPLPLSASPAPVSAPGDPTVPITYTLNNVADLGGGLGLPILFFSVGWIAPLDLLGMPGCNLTSPTAVDSLV